ncbi:hypothetical protein B0H13DRAFT_2542753 [Mycena leptocephala]|nr:hypothetical protein B0H13DRAFT_2542753 [Mycena leptocephala]
MSKPTTTFSLASALRRENGAWTVVDAVENIVEVDALQLALELIPRRILSALDGDVERTPRLEPQSACGNRQVAMEPTLLAPHVSEEFRQLPRPPPLGMRARPTSPRRFVQCQRGTEIFKAAPICEKLSVDNCLSVASRNMFISAADSKSWQIARHAERSGRGDGDTSTACQGPVESWGDVIEGMGTSDSSEVEVEGQRHIAGLLQTQSHISSQPSIADESEVSMSIADEPEGSGLYQKEYNARGQSKASIWKGLAAKEGPISAKNKVIGEVQAHRQLDGHRADSFARWYGENAGSSRLRSPNSISQNPVKRHSRFLRERVERGGELLATERRRERHDESRKKASATSTATALGVRCPCVTRWK